MDFAGGAEARAEAETHHGADGRGIADRAAQADAQAGPGAAIVVEFRRGVVLADGQIYSTVLVEVAEGAAALLAVNCEAAPLSFDLGKTAVAVAAQQQAAPGGVALGFGLGIKKVLAQEDVLGAVAVEVGDVDAKGGSELRREWQRARLETSAAIQEDRALQPIRVEA